MILEAIVALAVLIFVGALVIGLFKLVFTMVLLPIKLALFLVQGLLVLVIGLPLLIVVGLLLGAVLPLGLLVLLAPIWVLGGLVCLLLS